MVRLPVLLLLLLLQVKQRAVVMTLLYQKSLRCALNKQTRVDARAPVAIPMAARRSTRLGGREFLSWVVAVRSVAIPIAARRSTRARRLSNAARQSSSAGQIVNLMSNDANRFAEFSMFVIRCGTKEMISPVYSTCISSRWSHRG